MNNKVTVIGGAGFIGSHLVEALLGLGHSVTVIDNLSTGSRLNLKNLGLSIDFRQLDIAEGPTRLASVIKGSSHVFHLAALTSVQESLEDPTPYNIVNVVGTANVLEACRLAKVDRLIFSSTSAVYGNTDQFPTSESVKTDPISVYALTKAIGENYCKYYSEVHGIHTTCLRYFNVYGDRTNPNSSYRSVLPIFIEQTLAGEPLTYTNDGGQSRDFIHVSDVVSANIAAMDQRKYYDVINIGSGKTISINQIMQELGGRRKNIGARLEPRMSLAEISKAEKVLNWKPRVDVLAWIKDQIASRKQTVHQS